MGWVTVTSRFKLTDRSPEGTKLVKRLSFICMSLSSKACQGLLAFADRTPNTTVSNFKFKTQSSGILFAVRGKTHDCQPPAELPRSLRADVTSFEGENVFIRAPDTAKARLTVRLPWWLNLADDGAHTHSTLNGSITTQRPPLEEIARKVGLFDGSSVTLTPISEYMNVRRISATLNFRGVGWESLKPETRPCAANVLPCL